MAEAQLPTAPQPTLPLTQRLAETPPWTPARLGLAIAGGLLLAFLALELAFGRFAVLFGPSAGRWALRWRVDFRLALVMILLVAYLPAAHAYAARGARRAAAELRAFLRSSDPGAVRALAEIGCLDPGTLRRAGWIGLGIAALIPLLVDRSLSAFANWLYPVEPIMQRVLLPIVGWLMGRFLYDVWTESRRLSRIGREHVRVDLLDPGSFAPLTRQGLQQSLLAMGLLSILALYLYDYQKSGLAPVVLTAGATVLGVAVSALLLPLRGARQAIGAAKRAELAWCDAELRRARAALDAAPDGPAGRAPSRSIADLVAWRHLVAGVREWPLDAPALRRFGLYLALPLGSWLGGACVDHVVDVLLR
jgi:hypothetical protein